MQVHRVGSRHTFNIAAPLYYRRSLQQPFDIFVEDLNKVPIFAPRWAREPVGLIVHHLFGSTAFREASFPFAAATWLLERPLPLVYRSRPILAVSESTRTDLVARGFAAAQIRVVENGVDVQHYSPDPGQPRFERPTLLYLGRLKKYKGVDLVIQAFVRVLRQIPDAELIIAGTGDYAPQLQALIEQLGVKQHARLAGYVTEAEKMRLLRGAWLHTLASPKEGWGIANLEAAACGTATVASDSPGLRDSVRDGVTGYLVPHGDIEALAHRMLVVLKDPQERERLGRSARSFAQQFTWERAAQGMEGFLEAVKREAHGNLDRFTRGRGS